MMQPWIIALISTDYDLKDERKAIIDFLENKGIRVSAFEKADFPVVQNKHSHDNCLEVLNRVDIAILLIKKRYGGNYYLNEEVSITEEEYNRLNIPTVVLVNENVWNEMVTYRKQVEEFKGSPAIFKFTPAYADDVSVFKFIDSIQNSYQREGKSNWINFWKDYCDLVAKIPLVLQALGVNYVKRIKEEQINEVKARKTSTAFSMSLGDVFERGYYIEPDCRVESGTINQSGSIALAINEKLSLNESCMIVADAGAGKTTLIARSFLEKAKDNTSNFMFPIYVWLKGKGANYSFSIEDFLKDCCERYFHKERFPFFDIRDYKFTFYLDGFDELTEKLSFEDLDIIYRSEMFQWPIVLTSRFQYAERYILSNDFQSKFSCRIRVLDWNEDTSRRYISNFCKLQGKDDEFECNLNGLIADNEELHDIMKSPLLITVLLYVIERNRMRIPETIKSRATLLYKCLQLLAQREIDTKMSREKMPFDADGLVLQWAYLAWMIYEAKLSGENGVNISYGEEKIKSVLSVSDNVSWPQNIYDVIFDVIDGKLIGTFHEQFLEYLIANCLAYACKVKCWPYPDFLKHVMRPEINRYFRGIVEKEDPNDRSRIINNIHSLFLECAGSSDNEDIAMRVHAAYHLTRINGANDEGKIDRLFKIENEQAVLLSLYFGAIKQGNLIREKELYNLLKNDDRYNNANRGYHLAYYDSLKQSTIPYSDDVAVKWIGTLKAFLRHFSSDSLEHYYLRRIDLLTMSQLMEARESTEPLSDEILQELETCVKNPPTSSFYDYQKNVEKEFSRMKETYGRLNCSPPRGQ